MYEDEPVNGNVKHWACNILKLSKHKRHLDGAVQKKLFQAFDKWTSDRKFKHLAL